MTKTIKQTVLLPLLFILFAVLAWQLYMMFGVHKIVNVSHLHTAVKQIPAPAPDPLKNVTHHRSDVLRAAKTAPTPDLTPEQIAYMRLVHEYQLVQMKRLIAQDNEAIAVSTRNAAKAMVETAKLTGTKDFAAIAKPIVGETAADEAAEAPTYKLVYTGTAAGMWNATLKYKNRPYDVSVGSVLPSGLKVVAIRQDMVTLRRGLRQTQVSFNGVSSKQLPQFAQNKKTAAHLFSGKRVVSSAASANAKSQAKRQKAELIQLKTLGPLPGIKALSFSRPQKATTTKTTAKKIVTKKTAATPTAAKTRKTAAKKPTSKRASKRAPTAHARQAKINAEQRALEKLIFGKAQTPKLKAAGSKQATMKKSKPIARRKTSAKTRVGQVRQAKPLAKKTKTARRAKSTESAKTAAATVARKTTKAQRAQHLSRLKRSSLLAKAPRAKARPSKRATSALAAKRAAAKATHPAVALATSPNFSTHPGGAKPIIVKRSPTAKVRKPKVVKQARRAAPRQRQRATARYTSDEQTLLRSSGRMYTIQLMGNDSLKDIQRFIKANNLQGTALFYKTMVNHKPWYVLTYGEYPSEHAALSVINELPISLQRWSPFVKSFGEVRTELKRRG
jgi:SPOR domain